MTLQPAWSRDGHQNTVRNETQRQKYSADLTYFVFVYIIYYTNNSNLSNIFSHIYFGDFRAQGHFARIPSDSEVKTTTNRCYRSCNVASGRLEVLLKHTVVCHNITVQILNQSHTTLVLSVYSRLLVSTPTASDHRAFYKR